MVNILRLFVGFSFYLYGQLHILVFNCCYIRACLIKVFFFFIQDTLAENQDRDQTRQELETIQSGKDALKTDVSMVRCIIQEGGNEKEDF